MKKLKWVQGILVQEKRTDGLCTGCIGDGPQNDHLCCAAGKCFEMGGPTWVFTPIDLSFPFYVLECPDSKGAHFGCNKKNLERCNHPEDYRLHYCTVRMYRKFFLDPENRKHHINTSKKRKTEKWYMVPSDCGTIKVDVVGKNVIFYFEGYGVCSGEVHSHLRHLPRDTQRKLKWAAANNIRFDIQKNKPDHKPEGYK